MGTMQTIIRAGAMVVSFAFLVGCAGILEGPFNKYGMMVPELLYANNGTQYVTYWDDETNSYKTYDQANDVLLAKTIFTLEEARMLDPVGVRSNRRSQNFAMTASAVMPLTHLDEAGMKIQSEQGCVGCHTN